MSQGGWGGGGGGGGGWGPPGGGYPPGGAPPGGGYGGPPGGAPPGGGGYGQPPGGGAPPGGGGYGPPPGGAPPGGGGYGAPPGGAPPGGGGYGAPPGGGGYGPPPGGGGYGAPPGGGGYGAPPGGGGPGFAPTPQGYPPGYTPGTGGDAVAWEDKSRGLVSKWWGTTKAVLFDTRKFYASASSNEDPWPALTYSTLSSTLTGFAIGLFVALTYLIFGGMGAMLGGGGHGKSSAAGSGELFAIMGAMGMLALIIYPVLFAIGGFIGPWISAGMYHLTLMIFKGANKPYMSTVRVAGYAHAYHLWTMIPILGYVIGWLPAMIFALIATVVGLDETHRCGTGKAVLAALLIPGLLLLCCCGGYAALIAAAVGSAHR